MSDMENYLKRLKKEYLKTAVPKSLSEDGWLNLEEKLVEVKNPFVSNWYPRFAYASLGFVILFAGLFGFMRATWAADPGDILYPVKRISEKAVVSTTGNKQIHVDNRAKEIINLTQKKEKNETHLKETIDEYNKAVSEVKKDTDKSEEDKKEFEEKLERQKEQFKQASQNNSSEEDSKEAVKTAKEGLNKVEEKPSGEKQSSEEHEKESH